MKMTITNPTLNRSLRATGAQVRMYTDFLCGWSSASEHITPEETFAEVDRIKGLDRGYSNYDYEVGVLYGRVMSYQGLKYLNQELPIPKELWNMLSMHYVLRT